MKLAIQSDEYFMQQALIEAEKAFKEGEVPIGAVVVSDFRVIGRGHNQTERLQDPSAHAEMIALTAACDYLGSKYLQDCSLYVTIEPCAMCAGALRWAQLSSVIFGAGEPKYGFRRYQPVLLHPKTLIKGGVLESECANLMKTFFKDKR